MAALSAGVRSVMGPEMSSGASASVPDTSHPAVHATDAATAEEGTEAEATEENALVTSTEVLAALEDTGLIERKRVEARLPVQLDVGIPIRDFRVRNLVMLAPGALIKSQWTPGEDVPVASADVQLAWSEFEVVDTQLAVRLTRLS